MVDKQKRLSIPEDFRSNNSEIPEVHYYYSREEDLFYIRLEKSGEITANEFLVGIRKIDKKYRPYILDEIFDRYGNDFILAMKENKIYILPWKWSKKEE